MRRGLSLQRHLSTICRPRKHRRPITRRRRSLSRVLSGMSKREECERCRELGRCREGAGRRTGQRGRRGDGGGDRQKELERVTIRNDRDATSIINDHGIEAELENARYIRARVPSGSSL